MITEFDPIFVSPPEPQDTRTPEFEMRNGTRVVVRADGSIGSGVLFTGETPPTGWDMLATANDRDWPYRGFEDSFRYSLIGTFVGRDIPTEWFYIGRGRTIIGNGRVSGLGVRLRLAVNRPHVDQRADGPNRGELRWRVNVKVHQFAGGEAPPSVPQDGWKWCEKCQGLAFSGNGAGRCPADGTHDHTRSG
ncbi:MAG: hypothetical protein LC733_11645, partial [Actinobacteria bacterium]|nr:hypothetical protein [Actinomycetota bacterium]